MRSFLLFSPSFRGARNANPESRNHGKIPGSPLSRCPGMTQELDGALQRVGEVGALPGEAAVAVRLAAEMAVGSGAPVDRPVELQRAADVGRRQTEQLGQ